LLSKVGVRPAYHTPPFTPSSRAVRIRSVQTLGSRPRPSGADLSGLRRPLRHFRRSSFRDLCPHKSTFLPPFTPRPLWRFHATMDALTPAGPALLRAPPRMNTVLRTQQVSLLHVPGLPDHSVSNHPRRPTAALTRHPSARRVPSRLRHLLAGSPTALAESSSSSYGLVVHLLRLPTPPRGDAVAVGYRPQSVCLKWTCTTPTRYAHRRTSL
jgi:hypothetical protein